MLLLQSTNYPFSQRRITRPQRIPYPEGQTHASKRGALVDALSSINERSRSSSCPPYKCTTSFQSECTPAAEAALLPSISNLPHPCFCPDDGSTWMYQPDLHKRPLIPDSYMFPYAPTDQLRDQTRAIAHVVGLPKVSSEQVAHYMIDGVFATQYDMSPTSPPSIPSDSSVITDAIAGSLESEMVSMYPSDPVSTPLSRRKQRILRPFVAHEILTTLPECWNQSITARVSHRIKVQGPPVTAIGMLIQRPVSVCRPETDQWSLTLASGVIRPPGPYLHSISTMLEAFKLPSTPTDIHPSQKTPIQMESTWAEHISAFRSESAPTLDESDTAPSATDIMLAHTDGGVECRSTNPGATACRLVNTWLGNAQRATNVACPNPQMVIFTSDNISAVRVTSNPRYIPPPLAQEPVPRGTGRPALRHVGHRDATPGVVQVPSLFGVTATPTLGRAGRVRAAKVASRAIVTAPLFPIGVRSYLAAVDTLMPPPAAELPVVAIESPSTVVPPGVTVEPPTTTATVVVIEPPVPTVAAGLTAVEDPPAPLPLPAPHVATSEAIAAVTAIHAPDGVPMEPHGNSSQVITTLTAGVGVDSALTAGTAVDSALTAGTGVDSALTAGTGVDSTVKLIAEPASIVGGAVNTTGFDPSRFCQQLAMPAEPPSPPGRVPTNEGENVASSRDIDSTTAAVIHIASTTVTQTQTRGIFCPWRQTGVTFVAPLQMLMKPEMLERHPLLTSRLLLDCNIACIDAAAMGNPRTELQGAFVSPVDLIVDCLTAICIIDPLVDFSTSHKHIFKQLLRKLTYDIHKYKTIYIVVCVEELCNVPAPDVYMLLYQAVARYPADIICRTIQPAFLARSVNNICVESAKQMAMRHDVLNQEYTSRAYLSRLVPEEEAQAATGAVNNTDSGGGDNSGFIAQCEFLQFCPMINLFQAAALLHRVSLKNLAAPGVTRTEMQQMFLEPAWGAGLYDLLHTKL